MFSSGSARLKKQGFGVFRQRLLKHLSPFSYFSTGGLLAATSPEAIAFYHGLRWSFHINTRANALQNSRSNLLAAAIASADRSAIKAVAVAIDATMERIAGRRINWRNWRHQNRFSSCAVFHMLMTFEMFKQ